MALRVDPNQLDIVTPITRDLRKKIIQPIGSHAYDMPLVFTVSILLMFDPRNPPSGRGDLRSCAR